MDGSGGADEGQEGRSQAGSCRPAVGAGFGSAGKRVPVEGEFLFPGGKEGCGWLSNAAMSELLKGMGYSPDIATVHGFRSTFKDWASEQTAYPNELSEMAMAHTVSDKVEAAYRRGDMRDKRRRLMADWASYCDAKAIGGNNVVRINERQETA